MTDDGVPAVHTTIAEEPWSAHHYANVQLAQANMHGYGSRTTKTSTSRKVKMCVFKTPLAVLYVFKTPLVVLCIFKTPLVVLCVFKTPLAVLCVLTILAVLYVFKTPLVVLCF